MTTLNLFRRLQELLPPERVFTGKVLSVVADDKTAQVQLTGAGVLSVRNPLAMVVGASVFVQGGAITGAAPDLPLLTIEI
ncbi:hypothetical protein [Acidovorax sp. SUPP2825]|uniref:hypothetical protein n=1 Tax=Acidovorax sp. SUPP2825 TaxID=2920879 RepID=UPI0023DE25D8|nr:hypothetical protein [Acidovorax sp. SUPP2825]GKS97318.1 hypothetical protein AVAK2825_22305 [Acidovorax sp. SUPP2825]